MLRLENVTKEYSNLLFKDVSFMLGGSEKVGLVGLNGCGKTTLFRIILGIEAPDEGVVETGEETIGYLPQELDLTIDDLVGEFLESLVADPITEFHKVERILAAVRLQDVDQYQHIGTLSEGQKMKLYLVKIQMEQEGRSAAAKPPILLLDEPTNHLDISTKEAIEEMLRDFKGGFLLISHDRYFVNSIGIDRAITIGGSTIVDVCDTTSSLPL